MMDDGDAGEAKIASGAGGAGMAGAAENAVSPADEARHDEDYPFLSNEDEEKLLP